MNVFLSRIIFLLVLGRLAYTLPSFLSLPIQISLEIAYKLQANKPNFEK